MKLIIAEKPSVGKAIASAIGATQNGKGCIKGNGYIVSWCFGHLMTLFMPDDYGEQWAGDWNFSQLPMIPEKWRFKILKSCGEQYKVVKDLMNSNEVDEIICATDADREGECIFRYVFYSSRSQKPYTSNKKQKKEGHRNCLHHSVLYCLRSTHVHIVTDMRTFHSQFLSLAFHTFLSMYSFYSVLPNL